MAYRGFRLGVLYQQPEFSAPIHVEPYDAVYGQRQDRHPKRCNRFSGRHRHGRTGLWLLVANLPEHQPVGGPNYRCLVCDSVDTGKAEVDRRDSVVVALWRDGDANSLVVYIGYNAEKILLGRYWGAAPLGLYGRAYQLSNMPVQPVTDSFAAVAFPTLSRLQAEPERLRRAYMQAHSLVVTLTVPAVIACALFADEIVRSAGTQVEWVGSDCAVARASHARVRADEPAFLASARHRPSPESLNIAFFIAQVIILAVFIGVHYGPTGVALGYSAAMVLLYVPLVSWAKHKTGITTGDYWECIKRPVVATAVAGVAAAALKLAFQTSLPPLPSFIIELAVFSAVYAGLLLFVMGQKGIYADLLGHLFRKSSEMPVGG